MDSVETDLVDAILRNALSAETIFRDRRALTSDFVPQHLPFREEQITQLAQSLAPVLRNSRCSNLLVYGKTGTGKTATARYVLARLVQNAVAHGLKVTYCYANSRVCGTPYRLLAELASSLQLQVPFTGLALSELFERIVSWMNRNHHSVLLVIDEIDHLIKSQGDVLLYEVTRVHERLTNSLMPIIGISNDLKFKEYLDARVLSSLSEEEIVFPPYTPEQLTLILQERCKLALRESGIEQPAINLCAALAGSEHGDARRAVDLLRVAAELADRQGSGAITENHIRAAVQKIEQDRLVDALMSLPLHAKLILLSITKSQAKSSTGQVFSGYQALCASCGSDPLTQRRVSGILSELHLMGVINANVISQGRLGRSKSVSLLVPISTVRDILSQDSLLRHLS